LVPGRLCRGCPRPPRRYRSENNWQENERQAIEIFNKIKAELQSHQSKADTGKEGHTAQIKFLDEDFLTDKAWFAGGQPDELQEVGDAPASWIRMCPAPPV
jgi:hypothetical protein